MQNFMKTIINAVQSWTKKEIKNSTADWNQNDASAADYVKNKPDVVLQSDLKILENDIEGTLSDINENLNYTQRTKMDKNNPVGTGNFSMNRRNNTIVGTNSHAEGYNTTASGNYSHAEGYFTQATINASTPASSVYVGEESGYAAHAEGYWTVSSGAVSHAEGNGTLASGRNSHAEGRQTVASGFSSHAEGHYARATGSCSHAEGGNTEASNSNSHAEGYDTTASGSASHAEGTNTIASGFSSHAEGRYTSATGRSQHIQGEYNIIDITDSASTKSKYAHIVGNGTSNTARSNAHTLDWNGVGWFQGGLQVGGTAQDDGAKNVMLEGNAYDYFILNDVSTGTPYKIQIIDGNLVSSAMTIETEPTT